MKIIHWVDAENFNTKFWVVLKILKVINSPKNVGDKRITRVFIECIKHLHDSGVMHHLREIINDVRLFHIQEFWFLWSQDNSFSKISMTQQVNMGSYYTRRKLNSLHDCKNRIEVISRI